MSTIEYSYIAFCCIVPLLLLIAGTRYGVIASYLVGWLLLPIGQHPAFEVDGAFPWWITGLALPSDILLNKAWVIPTVILICAVIFAPKTSRDFKFSVLDFLMLPWCLWPLFGMYQTTEPVPAALISSLSLFGTWGSTWLIGRIFFGSSEGLRTLLIALAWSGVACLPLVILEGFGGMGLYGLVYDAHPFETDGLERYFGNRPMGFFEHGNQYGIWVAMAAVAALGVYLSRSSKEGRSLSFMLVVATATIAVASQSVGAILLMILCFAMLLLWRFKITAWLVYGGMFVLVALAGLHISGIVPIEHIAYNTGFGTAVLSAFESIGRLSFLWRISQDLKNIEMVQDFLIFGSHIWDWWRPNGSRPWGLWLLLIGQFGLVGFMLVYGCLSWPALRVMASDKFGSNSMALGAAMIILAGMLDSFLNAFFYFPAILLASAIAKRPT